MKLDYDLIRNLLLRIEEDSDGHTNFSLFYFFEAFPEVDKASIDYHLKYLYDAGFVEGSRDFIIDITPYGREYLDSIRDKNIWENTKKKFQPLGTVTFSVISDIAKSLVLKQLGL